MPRVGCVDSGKMPQLSINTGSRVILCLSSVFNFYSNTTEAKKGLGIKKIDWNGVRMGQDRAVFIKKKPKQTNKTCRLLCACYLMQNKRHQIPYRFCLSSCFCSEEMCQNKRINSPTHRGVHVKRHPHKVITFFLFLLWSVTSNGHPWTLCNLVSHTARPCSLRSSFNCSPMWSQLRSNAKYQRIKEEQS